MKRVIDIGAKVFPFVLILAALALAGLWTLEPVRLEALTALGEHDPQRVESALDDPSGKVVAQACFFAMQQHTGKPPAHLIDTLQERPEAALLCLEKSHETQAAAEEAAAKKAGDAAAAAEHNPLIRRDVDLVPPYRLAATTLGKRWMAELIAGQTNKCQTARNARRALDYAQLDPTYRLMSCAIAADSEAVRDCCVQELGGTQAFEELLDQSGDVPLRQALDHYSALVEASFPSVALASSTDEQADQKTVDGDERFGELQHDVQDWAVDVGCRLHFDDPSSRKTVEAFVPLIESKGCSPNDPPWQGYYSRQSWSDMCTGMYSWRRRDQGMSPREAICDSLERVITAQAVAATQMVIGVALSEAYQEPGVTTDDMGVGRGADGVRFVRPRPNAHRRNGGAFDGMLRQFVGF